MELVKKQRWRAAGLFSLQTKLIMYNGFQTYYNLLFKYNGFGCAWSTRNRPQLQNLALPDKTGRDRRVRSEKMYQVLMSPAHSLPVRRECLNEDSNSPYYRNNSAKRKYSCWPAVRVARAIINKTKTLSFPLVASQHPPLQSATASGRMTQPKPWQELCYVSNTHARTHAHRTFTNVSHPPENKMPLSEFR